MPDGDRSLGLVDIAIEPKWRADGEQRSFRDRLDRLVAEDTDLQVHVDEESGQAILSGRDEAHLEAAVERLRAGMAINVGAPQVAYRETISKAVELTYTEQKAGSPGFARILLRVSPATGVTFRSMLPEGRAPREWIGAVEAGVRSVLAAGPVIGFPMVGVDVALLNAEFAPTLSPLDGFEAAGRKGLRAIVETAGAYSLEPIMCIEVIAPESCIGDIIDDLNSRRGALERATQREASYAVAGLVPLANMFGYANALRALSHGLASYRLEFDHYERTPGPLDPDDGFRPAMAMRA